MALSNPKTTVVEAELETDGFYGFLYQLRISADGSKLLARAWATSTDGDAVPIVGVIDMPAGKEPDPSGPKKAGVAGDTLNFVVDGVVRAFVHVKTRDLVARQELYIGTSAGDPNMKLVNDFGDSPASALSNDVTTAARISDWTKYVRAQYIESGSVVHGGGTQMMAKLVRVINNPPIPA